MKKLTLITLLLLFSASISFARGGQGRGPGGNQRGGQEGKRGGPPQEAISACESKDAETSCSFTGGQGETVSGTCVEVEDQTVCVPEGMKPPKQDR